jgi:uncharacterized protein YjdB
MRPAYFRRAAAAILIAACAEKSTVSAPESRITATSGGDIATSVAPSPATADPIILEDNFDRYTDSDDLHFNGGYDRAGEISMVTGRNGIGRAVRFSYAPGATWNLLAKSIPRSPDLFVRYWYRASPGADPSNAGTNRWGLTMLQAQRASGERWQVSVAKWSLLFGVDDSDMPNVYQNVIRTPRFGTTNDGQWHELAVRLVDGPSGYAMEWVDGTLVTDTRGNGYSHPSIGVNLLAFPGELFADPRTPFTIDIDDIVAWAPATASNPTPPSPPPVARVSVAPATVSLLPGDSTQVNVTVSDTAGNALTDRAVTWSSSNTAIATVSATGVVRSIAQGSAVITATCEGLSGSTQVTVGAVPVAAVSVALNAPSLTPGNTTQATATVRDASGAILTGRSITWTSSNTSAATVSASGLVTAVAAGSANIIATSEGKSGQAAITVTPPPVATVTVSPSSGNLVAGATLQLTATLRDASGATLTNRSIAWTSSDNAIATVSATGLVTAVAVGSVNIVATSEGQTGQAALTVTAPPASVASVSVVLNASAISVGQTTQASATLRDANNNVLTGRVITWSSSNTGVATVSASGVVAAVTAGTAQIRATSEGITGSATLTVNPPPVATVTVVLSASSLTTGQTTQATATLRDAANNVLTGRTITWSSSNSAVATVTASGLVTAVTAGSANIIATSEGKTGQAALTVTAPVVPVATVTVAPMSTSVAVGATVQLSVTLRDASNNILTGRVVTWSSSNTSVATVSSAGLVRGIAGGTATVTATSEGHSGTSAITVTAPPPPPTGTGEPVYDPTRHLLVLRDNFDQYATITAAINAYPTNRGTEFMGLTTGRGGTGKAIRFNYGIGAADDIVFGPANQLEQVGAWNGTLPQKAGPFTHLFFSTWFRTSPGSDPADHDFSGIKGFMFEHTGNQRYQNAVNRIGEDNLTRGPKGANPDNATSGFNLYKTPDGKAPLWSTYGDGNWHRFTIELYAGGDPSGHWGERYWLDGVLIYDDVDLHVGSGTVADHYDYQYPITWWMFWGNFVNSSARSNFFTMDMDDWISWTN